MNHSTSPIFIVGAPRSGTTLLQYMLRSHPDISMPTGESHFFIPLLRHEKEYGDLRKIEDIRSVLLRMHDQSANFLDTDLHGVDFDIDHLSIALHKKQCTTMAQLISGLFELNAKGENARRWGDKTPYYVLHMKMLLERFPGAQFIHLIRDGRDCALSMFQRKHDFRVYNTFFAAKYWEIYVELGRNVGIEIGPKNYHEIRYEDLLENPELVLKGVCNFLNEKYSESLVNFKKSGEAGKTPLLQQPIQKQNQEKWRTNMSPRQIKLFENTVAETLTACNYQLLNKPKTIPIIEKAIWRTHNYMISKFHKYITNK
ncbi:MAG: sulfotransferase [Candidatus Reddybacter sp.]